METKVQNMLTSGVATQIMFSRDVGEWEAVENG